MAGDVKRLQRVFNPPPPYYDVRGTTTFELVRANRALRAFLAAERREVGVPEGRDLVLLEIARGAGRATPKQLQETLGLSANALSTVLRRSVDAGLVVRRRDVRDRRKWRLELTSTGQAVALLGAQVWRTGDAALTSRLGESKAAWLRHLMGEARKLWLSGSSGSSGAGEGGSPGRDRSLG